MKRECTNKPVNCHSYQLNSDKKYWLYNKFSLLSEVHWQRRLCWKIMYKFMCVCVCVAENHTIRWNYCNLGTFGGVGTPLQGPLIFHSMNYVPLWMNTVWPYQWRCHLIRNSITWSPTYCKSLPSLIKTITFTKVGSVNFSSWAEVKLLCLVSCGFMAYQHHHHDVAVLAQISLSCHPSLSSIAPG